MVAQTLTLTLTLNPNPNPNPDPDPDPNPNPAGGGAGALLYWDHRAPGARAAAALPATSPAPIGAWQRSFRKARFLAVSAC